MTETEAPQLNLLRQAIANLNQHEKLALATFLTGTSNPSFQDLVVTPESDKLTTDLAEACELSRLFSPDTRIFFAIELLELQIDRDSFEKDEDEDEDDGESYKPSQEEERLEREERTNRMAWCLQDGPYPGDEEED
jgi:hypothetical protein